MYLSTVFAIFLVIVHSDLSVAYGAQGGRRIGRGGANPRVAIFDYIVVGAGSTGAVVANRLSENGKYRVLLLEKGGLPSPIAEVPALAPQMWDTENADKYATEPQKGFFMGLEDQRPVWLRGKGLGGTSLMNYMVYTRGPSEYWDRLAAAGNPGWSYADVMPYFMEMETAHIAYFNQRTRGSKGELHIRENQVRSEAAKAFVEASQQSGLPFLKDYNTNNPSGVAYVQVNVCDGRRCHSERAFLRDIKNRANLQIEINALVTKLIIGRDGSTVEGVEYIQEGRPRMARAGKEVILSAGALASPQILMLSGIGPRKHLQEMGISVVKDMPVGQFIYDHVSYPGIMFELNANITPDARDFVNPNAWKEFLLEKTGSLTVPGLALEALGFVKTPVSNDTADFPDAEYIYLSGGFSTDNGQALKTEWRFTDETYDTLFQPYEGKQIWSVLLLLFRPESHGYMRLRSTNPADRPRFYPNYFSDPENRDMRSMIAAIRILQKINQSPALARYGSKMNLRSLPGCRGTVPDTDEFWECMIRHLGTCTYHETATTRMGPKSDPTAIVDHELRVHGMNNLRIADLGIFPDPISAHPNGPAMMMGSKAADMILKAQEGGTQQYNRHHHHHHRNQGYSESNGAIYFVN